MIGASAGKGLDPGSSAQDDNLNDKGQPKGPLVLDMLNPDAAWGEGDGRGSWDGSATGPYRLDRYLAGGLSFIWTGAFPLGTEVIVIDTLP